MNYFATIQYIIIGEAYKRVGDDMTIIFGDDKDSARQDILSRIRFYAYPYAVHASRTSGWGFLFVQSDSSLAVMSLPVPVLSNGRKYSKCRSVLLHWLTIKEYVSERLRVGGGDVGAEGGRRGLRRDCRVAGAYAIPMRSRRGRDHLSSRTSSSVWYSGGNTTDEAMVRRCSSKLMTCKEK